MSIKIGDYFDKPSESTWKEAVKASMKFQHDKDVDQLLTSSSLEGIDLDILPQERSEIYLNTFPTKRILGREIDEGQLHPEQQDLGINYVISSQPVVLPKNQVLVQILKNKSATHFGDQVLLDVFELLQEFSFSLEDLNEFIEKKLEKENTHLLINASVIHDAGGSIVHELSHAMFLALKFVDRFIQKNRKVCFLVSVDSQFYLQVSKLRALRYLYETILENLNMSNENLLIMARSSLRELTLYDPWVNMLRVSTNMTASFIGGADVLVPKSYDGLNPFYRLGASSKMALRHSRNVFHVLNEESGFTKINDTARGSKVIEDLTHKLIEKSFDQLKSFNSQESLKFLYENMAQAVADLSQKRMEEINFRKVNLCGINNFVNIDERLSHLLKLKNLEVNKKELFPLRRNSLEFEKLRLSFEKSIDKNNKKVLILSFGDLKKLNSRYMFCRNYFEILGVEIEHHQINDFVNFDPKKYFSIIFCAQDDDYKEMFEMINDLSETQLFVASKNVKKTGFKNIYAGQDVFAVLSEFVSKAKS